MAKISLEEGSPQVIFKCSNCKVAYDTKEEYEEHCKSEPQRHLQDGQAPCIYCQEIVTFNGLPFTKDAEPTPAICDECFDTVVKPAIDARGNQNV